MIHRMLRKFVQGRAFLCALACLLALSLPTTCALIPVERAYASTAELTVGHKIEYGGYDTNAFTVNGFEAYCGDPGSRTPPAGLYEMQPTEDRSIAAGLWFGFGGPGFDASLWPAASWDGPMTDDAHRVATHVSLAYLASGSAEFAYGTCDDVFKRWCDEQLFAAGGICARIRTEGFGIAGLDGQPAGFTAHVMSTGSDTQVMYAMDYRPHGRFTLQKTSARPSLSDDNGIYSLANARYDVFADAACTQPVASMITDEAGTARSPELEPGTYYVKEVVPPPGYALDPAITAVQVSANVVATVQAADEPQSTSVELVLRKIDAETGAPVPLGGASLAGAEYEVRFFAGRFSDAATAEASGTLRRSWTMRTDENGELHLDEASKVSGEELYFDAEGRIVLPLGTVIIRESAPPAGYLLDDTAFVLNVEPNGTTASVSAPAAPTHPEQVVRGDLTFVKASEADQHRMGGVPFLLASNTTGEAHVVVTDENGAVRTHADWNPHEQRTNANDAALSADGTVDESLLNPSAGLWFGTEEPRNDLGALPYDTYSLQELRATANAGYDLVEIPSIVVSRAGTTIDLGTVTDRPAPMPAVRTSARDGLDGDKTVDPLPDASIIDRVNCMGLTVGTEYRVTGRLVRRDDGSTVAGAQNTPVTAETTFAATTDSATVELTFPFDATAHADSDIVVFETLEDRTTGEAVVTESNLDEYEQTVRVLPASEEPVAPTVPETPSPLPVSAPAEQPASSGHALAATGDAFTGALIGALLATSTLVAGACAMLVRRARPSKRRVCRQRLRRSGR